MSLAERRGIALPRKLDIADHSTATSHTGPLPRLDVQEDLSSDDHKEEEANVLFTVARETLLSPPKPKQASRYSAAVMESAWVRRELEGLLDDLANPPSRCTSNQALPTMLTAAAKACTAAAS